MKKFLQEVVTYFWIPLILGLVSYVFFQLHDMLLGVIILIALSAVYTIIRIYFLHKKWWLLVILAAIAFISIGYFIIRAPSTNLFINGQNVSGTSINFTAGSVSVNPGPGSTGKYTKNTVVTLTANPNTNYDWKRWYGTTADTSNPTTVVMNTDKPITVAFEPRFSIVINNQLVIGSIVSFTEGSVSVSPAPERDGKYASGTVVGLTARSGPGYDWKNWSATGNDTSNPTTVTMDANKHITVTFEPRFSLTIGNQLVIGSSVVFNEGSVSVVPPPGNDDKYAKDTKVTLTAVPESSHGWRSWSGTGNDTSNPTTVTISSDKHVAVAFDLRFSLTINSQIVNNASTSFAGGSVSVSPVPGADVLYAKNVSVALMANPESGYRFHHWSGDITGNTPSFTITMNGNKNVTATFIKVYTLATAINPADSGSVSPGGGTYDEGASVTITATPAAGYHFDHWGDDASGKTTSTTVVMNGNKHVSAIFVKVYTLATGISPIDGGSVTPASGNYDDGATVIIKANPAPGFRFDRWGGDIAGNTISTAVIMNDNKSVFAIFIKVYNLTITISPVEGGSVSPASGAYDDGTSVTITATPAAGYRFDRWSGDVTGNTASTTITMNSNKSITAIFVKTTP